MVKTYCPGNMYVCNEGEECKACGGEGIHYSQPPYTYEKNGTENTSTQGA